MSSTLHKKLIAKSRNVFGNSAKKIRRNGEVLGVVYGYGLKESLPIQIDYRSFEKTLKTEGSTGVVDIDLDGKKISSLIHSVQFHPVTEQIQHVDFIAVNMRQNVEATVPLTFVGVSLAVKQDGAVLNKLYESVTVEALPDNIPHEIEVNVESIENLDSIITIADIAKFLPSNVKIMEDPEDVVVSAQIIAEIPDEETPTPETIIETGVDTEEKKD
jgi:large subunit ribosomal protein L25